MNQRLIPLPANTPCPACRAQASFLDTHGRRRPAGWDLWVVVCMTCGHLFARAADVSWSRDLTPQEKRRLLDHPRAAYLRRQQNLAVKAMWG